VGPGAAATTSGQRSPACGDDAEPAAPADPEECVPVTELVAGVTYEDPFCGEDY
jgi:hypothetical protein